MTISTHTYALTVKRDGKRDAVLRITGGRVVLDAGRAPHVTADIDVAVPAEWYPLEPITSGRWEPTGAPQFDFISDDPDDENYYLSDPAFVWVPNDPQLWVDPEDDPRDPEAPTPETFDFIPADPADENYYPTPDVYLPPARPPKTAGLLDIDPRVSTRLVLTATRVDINGATQRDFDLVLRDRAITQSDGTVTLQLASDEALLEDYAPLADDPTPFDLAGSLQDVCDYVLDVAIPGAALSDSADSDLTPGWSTTNLIPNPADRTFTHTTPTGDADLATATEIPAKPGDQLTLSLGVSSPSPMNVALAVRFVDEAGTELSTSSGVSQEVYSSAARRRHTTEQAPTGTAYAVPVVTWTGSASGRVLTVADPTLTSGIFDPGPFDGNTPESDRYRYSWDDAPYASPSHRTLIGDAPDPEAFIWRAGTSGLEFLAPLVQAAGLRLVCTEDREWTLRTSEWQAPGNANITYAVDMIDAVDRISRTDDSWFDAAVVVYEWTDRDGIPRTRTDSYALTTPHAKTRRFERSTPYPGPGFAQYAVERARGRGRQVTATKVSDWSVRAETPVKVILNGARPQLGRVQTVTFDLNTDEMTLDTRTLDEGTPA